MPYNQVSDYFEKQKSGLEKVLFSSKTDYSFNVRERIDPANARLAAGQASLVPSVHKSCKPLQAPIEWIFKAKEVHPKQGCNTNVNCPGNCGLHKGREDSENDLADMVQDFIEDGCYAHDTNDGGKRDSGASLVIHLCENLQAVSANVTAVEREIIYYITTLILGVNESEFLCQNSFMDCNAGCIRRLAVKHLKMFGYNASICKTKWQRTPKVPGGEYEYVDINFEGDSAHKERLIIDLDFRCQFEIARPSHHYQVAVKSVPLVFVGKSGKLEKILHIMSEAAKSSLKQNSLHIPPWRTIEYMRAKWLSTYERKHINSGDHHQLGNLYDNPDGSQCIEQLKRLKGALKADVGTGLVLKSITNGNRFVTKPKGEERGL